MLQHDRAFDRLPWIIPLVVLLLLAGPAAAQYVFLDANGDGVNSALDQLNPSGPTDLDVWFVTDQKRDGSAASCGTDPSQALTINSFEIVLQAFNGTVKFGPMESKLPFTGQPTSFAGWEDTTNVTSYHNGWGHRDIFPPGRYLVATLRVEILTGSPSLQFVGRRPAQPVDLTAFGTKCEGVDFDNTYVLGEEFTDASGIGGPHAEAHGPYYGIAGTPITLNGSRSGSADGTPLTYSWAFSDGGSASGAVVSHAFSSAGDYTATLTVTDGNGRTAQDDAAVHVDGPVAPAVPVAKTGGPYQGRVGTPVWFDGGTSFDPEGDVLSYEWTFGDAGAGTGQRPIHTYAEVGVYTVRLRVSDGTNTDEDETTCTIEALPLNHAPAASAGGPYEGIVGRWIQFDATASTDADGDVVTVQWDFGDNARGLGMVAAHAYARAGTFSVRATVSDGRLSATATTTAVVAAAFQAEAFLDGNNSVVNVDGEDEMVWVRFQSKEGSFRPEDVDPDRFELRIALPDGRVAIATQARSGIEDGDQNHDGVTEFVAGFSRTWLRDLVDTENIRGRTDAQLAGGLHRGGEGVGAFAVTFTRGHGPNLRVAPNPFNPATVVRIRTFKQGAVWAKLYDVSGRLVKSVLNGVSLPAGRHDFPMEALDDRGVALSSGIYFLQVSGPDGPTTGRVVVAK